MARKQDSAQGVTPVNGNDPNNIRNADFPEDGEAQIVDSNGNARELRFNDGMVNPPAHIDTKGIETPRFIVTKGGSYKCPFTPGTSKIEAGAVVTENTHSLTALKQAGITLAPYDADAEA
jgi:hypothetical protein